MDLLKRILFWKIVAFMVVLGVIIWIPTIEADVLGDNQITPGIRAAFAALAGAAALVLNIIPVPPERRGASEINLLSQLLAAVAAGIAGWYWLMDETNGDPWPYALPMLILGILVGTIMIGRAMWEFAADILKKNSAMLGGKSTRRGEQIAGDNSQSEECAPSRN